MQDRRVLKFRVAFILTMVTVFILTSFTVLAPNTYWTIEPNFFFQGTVGGGVIDFYATSTVVGWIWQNDLVTFNYIDTGAYADRQIGFGASSNCALMIVEVELLTLTYNVTADALQESVTEISRLGRGAPTNVTVNGVQVGTWSYAPSGVTTITSTHASTNKIVVTWGPSGGAGGTGLMLYVIITLLIGLIWYVWSSLMR